MKALLLASALALLAAASPARAQESTLAGTILDDATSAPVRSARVSLLPGGRAVLSDSLGRFVLTGLAAGEYAIQVQALGYERLAGGVQVSAAGPTVELRLTPDPIALAGVRVSAPADVRGTGFAERRAHHAGSGVFLDRTVLEARASSQLADVLRSAVPGVHFIRDPRTGALYATSGSAHAPGVLDRRSTRRKNNECFAQVFVDGVPRNTGNGDPVDLNDFSPSQLEAVEYYRHPSSTPVQFRAGSVVCGTLVIWTRDMQPPL